MLSKSQKRSYFQNLFLVANADGHYADEEKLFLEEVARKLGLESREAEKITNNPQKLDFIIPDSKDEKLKQLEDIIVLMMADKKIHKKEHELCLLFAEKIGYSRQKLDKIVKKVLSYDPAQINIRTYKEIFEYLEDLKFEQEDIIRILQNVIEGKVLTLADLSEIAQEVWYKFIWLLLVRMPVLRKESKEMIKIYLNMMEEKKYTLEELQKEMMDTEEAFGQSLIKMEEMILDEIKLDIIDALKTI